MTKEELIRMAREAWYLNGENVPSWHELERFAALVAVHTAAKEREWMQDINKRLIAEAVAAEREKVVRWMMERGYATGHGDTIEDLLTELEWQVRESERKACAELVDHILKEGGGTYGDAIRARGQE